MGGRMRRLTDPFLIVGMIALITSGCSAIDVEVTESDSKPVQVGVVDAPGTPSAPSPAAEPIPEEMILEPIDLGRNCPFTVEIGVDDEWHDDGAMDGFHLYSRQGGALLNVNCSEVNGDTVDEIITDARKLTYSESGAVLEKEKVGTMPGGKAWSHLGELGPDALRAVDDEPTRYGGAVIGAQKAGRTYKVSVEIMVAVRDRGNGGLIVDTIPTLTIDGTRVPSPRLS